MAKNFVIIVLALGLGLSLFLQFKPDQESQPRQANDAYNAVRLRLEELQKVPEFAPATVGFCLFDEKGPVVELNAYQSMIPASALKSVTAATALEILGVDFKFRTVLKSTAELGENGLMPGDLLIEGGGDPTLAYDDIQTWAAQLHADGWRTIGGRVIGDARHFPDHLAANAWDWGDLSNYYGAGPSGLNLDYNRFNAYLEPGDQPGDPTKLLGTEPELPWIRWVNQMVTGAEDASYIYGGPYAETLVLRGTIPADENPFTCRGAIPDPAYYTATRLAEALRAVGIEVAGEPTTMRRLKINGHDLPEGGAPLVEHLSEPLPDIVRHLLDVSDNMVTECLFQTLALKRDGESDAEKVIRNHWKKRGVTLKGLRMEDGSGLARADLIRPHDLAKISWLARRGPVGEVYRDTVDTYIDDRLRLKGGAMSKVRTMVGFVEGTSGKEHTFAIMLNNGDASSEVTGMMMVRILEALLEL